MALKGDAIMFDFDALINISNIQLGYLIAYILVFFIYRLFLALSVYIDGKENNIKFKGLWSFTSFVFGVISVIIYTVCSRNKRIKAASVCKKCFIIIAVAALLLSSAVYIVFGLSKTGEFGYILNPELDFDETCVVTFENNKGKKVIFDKMGNEYTFFKRNDLLYFDRNGDSYKCLDDTRSTVLNTENNQIYSEDDYNFYIDDEGYLCLIDDLYELYEYKNDCCNVYYDEEHLYYPISVVCWDKDGNVVFPQYIDELNSFTYEMAAREIGR